MIDSILMYVGDRVSDIGNQIRIWQQKRFNQKHLGEVNDLLNTLNYNVEVELEYDEMIIWIYRGNYSCVDAMIDANKIMRMSDLNMVKYQVKLAPYSEDNDVSLDEQVAS